MYHCLLTAKLRQKLKMLTNESKILIKNVWESKKYGVTRLIEDFQTRSGASVVWRTFWSDCDQRGPLYEHPVVDVVNHAIDEWIGAWSVSLCRCWRRTFWTLLMTATFKVTMLKWQRCKFDNWRWLFLFSFAVNVNEQSIIAFLTEKCCYLNLRSKVSTQLR